MGEVIPIPRAPRKARLTLREHLGGFELWWLHAPPDPRPILVARFPAWTAAVVSTDALAKSWGVTWSYAQAGAMA